MIELRNRPEVQEKLNNYLHSTSNPFRWLSAHYKAEKEKGNDLLKDRDYSHLTGGNGKGLTEPQRILRDRLGWATEYVIPVNPRRPNYPTNYKVDLADPFSMIAVEVDGHSHKTTKIQEADKRKVEYLQALGWQVLRFWNDQILSDLDAVVSQVFETVNNRKSH